LGQPVDTRVCPGVPLVVVEARRSAAAAAVAAAAAAEAAAAVAAAEHASASDWRQTLDDALLWQKSQTGYDPRLSPNAPWQDRRLPRNAAAAAAAGAEGSAAQAAVVGVVWLQRPDRRQGARHPHLSVASHERG